MTMRITFALLVCGMAAGLSSCSKTPTAPTTTIATPATETFSSVLAAKGTASRGFSTHNRGAVSVTVTSLTPAGTVVGIGVGIPRSSGIGCNLTAAANTTAGATAQLSLTAEVGDYCAEIFDPGTLTDTVAFTVTVTHP